MNTNFHFTGTFPIYGKQGDKATDSGIMFTSNPYEYYLKDKAAYVKGMGSAPFNGLINFITGSISNLYTAGIPEFRLAMSYPKGAVVMFKGEVYLSFLDNNTTCPNNSDTWGKLQIVANNSEFNPQKPEVTNCNEIQDDGLPVGTILTVPSSTERIGYIDYIPGESFNRILYPELFIALGTSTFESTDQTVSDSLPVGTIVHSLSDTVPNGWAKWSNLTDLSEYPELQSVLRNLVARMMPSESQSKWQQALANNKLPNFGTGSFFLRGDTTYGSNVGIFKNDSVKVSEFSLPPAYIPEDLVLNPLNISKCTKNQEIQFLYTSGNKSKSTTRANVVLMAQTPSMAGLTDAKFDVIELGNTDESFETAPQHLTTNLIIKVKTITSSTPSTHKQIIKCKTLGE